jgi:iron complex transport system substrate-binding protein
LNQLRIAGYELRILKYFVKLSLLCIFCTITACSERQQIQNPKFQITDDAGIVVGFDSIPKRIISLAPNITETLFAIGADSQLVGVTDLCDFPSEAKQKKKTGSYVSPDYETMTSLNPDLVIINVESTSNPTYQALMNMGLKTFVSNAGDIKGIFKMISDFGTMTGRQDSADALLKDLKESISSISTGESFFSEPALVLISVNPLMTTNGKTFINDILNLARITNMYKDEPLEYPNINFEDVISRNPYCIIFPTDTSDTQKSEKFTDEIKRQLGNTGAVKNNRIILIDGNIMFRPGPRIVEAAEILRLKYSEAIKE